MNIVDILAILLLGIAVGLLNGIAVGIVLVLKKIEKCEGKVKE